MSYKVIKSFRDLQDNLHTYIVGDPYPRKGVKVDSKRVKELSSVNNQANEILIREIKNTSDNNNEYPKNTGGSWYELSNGERVQGKKKAMKAENELQVGDK